MTGYLYIVGSASRSQPFVLSKEESYIDVGGAGVSIVNERSASSVAMVKWEVRKRSWTMTSMSDDVQLNHQSLKPRGNTLAKGDLFVYGTAMLRFDIERAEPLYAGETISKLSLDGLEKLVIGREVLDDQDVDKLSLDADDFTISKVHVELVKEGENWKVYDRSKTGSELNGRLFNEEELVYGDRFLVSEYIFEFNGSDLKRIDHHTLGALNAKDLIVTVKDRATGMPKNILDDVSVTTSPGQFIGILGGSGQGKSTLLDALCGIRPAPEGKVTIGGIKNTDLAKTRPGTIGYVPQDDIVHRELTVDQAFLYSAKLRLPLKKNQLDALIHRTVQILGLSEHRTKRIKFLSGGQRKRVSIGIELLSKPSILFLDEPSSGLDPATEKSLMELLQSLSLNNLTVVCTTHVLQNAFLFNKLWFVHGGKLIFGGNAEEAREFFLEKQQHSLSQSNITGRGYQSPLEKIYPTVLEGKLSAEEWEARYLDSSFYQNDYDQGLPASQVELDKVKQTTPIAKLKTLLVRQASIMSSDWLNVTFLIAQVLVIGLLVSWVAEDMGLRAFLGVIAAMWFGCSNGAQQIVAENAVFMRERVCGLGVNVYIWSKIMFQGAISSVQALLLFAVILFAGNVFHQDDFDSEFFQERLVERNFPYLVDDSMMNEESDDMIFVPAEEGMDVEEIDDSAMDIEFSQEEVQKVALAGLVEWVAKTLSLSENILDSGDKPLFLSDGSPLMGRDMKQMFIPGQSIAAVISTTLALRLAAFLGAAIVGVCLGLMVSSLVRTPTQAVMWVPLLLIPQILFGGFVISLPEMTKLVRSASFVFPSYSCQRLCDVSHIFGRATPYLTNRTKYPIFLTSEGDKEKVSWSIDGKKYTQNYDEVSDVNTSWQNLGIHFHQISQHKQEYSKIKGSYKKIYKDTVSERRDVKYKKGTPFLHTAPATTALCVLVGWFAFTYGVILLALSRKKIG